MSDTDIPGTDTALDLDALSALERAATPAPWEPGDPWLTAGLIYDEDGERVGAGPSATRCAFCHHGEPVWAGRRDINGTRMAAHIHRNREVLRPEHYIAGPPGVLVAANFDYEVGGIVSPEDVALIVAMRNALPALLSALAAAREELAETERERDRFREHSVLLNTVQWKIAEALGEVPEGAESVPHDPSRVDRLVAEADKLRAELAEARRELDMYRYEVGHADAEREEAERNRDAARAEADGLRVELRDALIAQQIVTATLGAVPAAAPQADEPASDYHPLSYHQYRYEVRDSIGGYVHDPACWCRKAAVPGDGEQAATTPPTCHLPVQNGEWCGLVICRKGGCRAAVASARLETTGDNGTVTP